MTSLLLQFAATKLALSLALGIVVWGVQLRFNRPQINHLLWLLVLATMITPTLVTLPILHHADPLLETSALSQLANPIEATPGTLNLATALLVVWAIGSLALLSTSLLRMERFHRALHAASRVAPASIQQLARDVAAQLDLRRVPLVHITDATISPLVWWIGGEIRIVIPSSLLSELRGDQLRLILAHELAHVLRRDHLTRWLEWTVCILFWWNPVVWLARRSIRAAEELCCDALVIVSLRPAPKQYAQALMQIVDWISHSPAVPTPAVAITAISSGRSTHLYERLTMIVTNSALTISPRWAAITRSMAVALLPLGLFGVTSVEAQVARKTAEPTLNCASLLAEIKPAIAAGSITAEQGEKLKNACSDSEKTMRPKEVSKSRVVDAEEAVKKPSEKLKEKVLSPSYEEAVQEIRVAVESGRVSPEEGKAKLEMIGKLMEKSVKAEEVRKSQKVESRCAEAEVAIRRAIEAGQVSVEAGNARIAAACKGG